MERPFLNLSGKDVRNRYIRFTCKMAEMKDRNEIRKRNKVKRRMEKGTELNLNVFIDSF
jgi:hypothetical protein